LVRLPSRLYEMHKDRIRLSSPVSKIIPKDREWLVRSDRGEERYSSVVWAAPLPLLEQARSGFRSHVEYASTKIYVARGKLHPRLERGDSLFIGDSSAGVDGISRYRGGLYKVSGRGRTPDWRAFFSSFEILAEQPWPFAVPKSPPNSKFRILNPEPGLYAAGDYLFPCMESAVATGTLVARHISGRAAA
jgi:predicted NAD/FAD-dependent oxidoreductase